MTDPADAVVGTYRRHFRAFDRTRSRNLFEKIWLDRFLETMSSHPSVLDIGCGMGEPIARYLIEQGCLVTGIDSSPGMLSLCRERFANHEWIEADMRQLDLGRRFEGVIAFDSFFFLTQAQQRAMFSVFAAHAAPDAVLLFTSGPEAGERYGEFEGEPLHHASLSPAEYRTLLDRNGFDVVRFVAEDSDCAGHSVWLARRRAD